jgi:hypothetical protein
MLLGGALVVGLIVFLVVQLTSTDAEVAPTGDLSDPSSRPVFVYGDSNLMLAEEFLDDGAIVRATGQSSPCTFFTKMQQDAATNPRVVVLAFTGGNFWPCARGLPRYDAYARDYAKARAIFPKSTKVYVVLPTPTRRPAQIFLAAASNRDVYDAAKGSGLPTLDAWSELGGADAPYTVYDGIHLTLEGARIYAEVLSEAW